MSTDDVTDKKESNTSLKNDNKVDLSILTDTPKKSSENQKESTIENDSLNMPQETKFTIQNRLTNKIDRNVGVHVYLYDKCENKHEIELNSSKVKFI